MTMSSIFFIIFVLCSFSSYSVAREISALTYNTGLIRSKLVGPFNFEARAPLLYKELAKLDADFVCLQEVWLDREQRAVINAVPSAYQYHSFLNLSRPLASAPIPCENSADTVTFATCYATYCQEETSLYNALSCLAVHCPTELNKIIADLDCYNCLAFQLGLQNPNTFQYCMTNNEEYWTPSAGVVLLSKHKLKNTKATYLPAFDVIRGYLYAEATVPNWGDVAVSCVHLSPLIYGQPYTPPSGTTFQNVQEESLYQADTVITAMNASGIPANQIFLGDFNSSPKGPGIDESLPETYNLIKAKGFTPNTLFGAFSEPRDMCTWCHDNLNINVLTDPTQSVIDHVFIRGFAAKRREILVDEVSRHYDTLVNGYHLSDHYATRWTRLQAPTCTDRKQNGDEAGVDCGGSCDACISRRECRRH